MSEIIASTYEVIEKIGAGGGGVVYLANHLRLGKKVVLKADKRKITTRPEILRREVDVLKNLSHTYIPQVYDFFAEGETVYTVMDYIEGESLDRPLKRGEKFEQPRVIKWCIQLLEALCYLHSPTHGDPPRGIVHSDIKPANIMRTPLDDICLIDFNIALALGEENVVGRSEGYSSPEHYGLDFSFSSNYTSSSATDISKTVAMDGDETLPMTEPERSATSSKRIIIPDARSDIYSIGATLYHLLSGKKPDKDALQVIPLSEKEYSPQLVSIITKAMNPNPDLRYQTAEEMLFAVTHLKENDSRTKHLKRVSIVAAAVFAILIAGGSLCAFTGLKRMQAEQTSLTLAGYSSDALRAGDTAGAVGYALRAISTDKGLFAVPYTAPA